MQTIALSDYCNLHGMDYNTAYQGLYKSDKAGNIPCYVSKKNKTYYIDMKLLDEKMNQEKNAWVFATTYTYWWLTDWMKMNCTTIADELSKRSKIYTSKESWNMFLSRNLFNIPTLSIYKDGNSMVREFTVYGTAMVLAYYRDNYMV